MDRSSAIEQIREACKNIAIQSMKLQPAIKHLGDDSAQADCIKAAYELTVQLETIKKRIGRLEKQDDNTLL